MTAALVASWAVVVSLVGVVLWNMVGLIHEERRWRRHEAEKYYADAS